ncbi:Agenet domain-containing protein [Abeliophyllum distichum]|uniref:Agenet domain-containing protein n=1 Tax=Abeliophyllum distichum TaxID=126358 RepID=A0ABD1Q0Q9_9LAMI
MDKRISLPFTVGEEAEARTFEKGYRGAWFRCKIREIRRRKGDVEYLLEYFDFPEEKLGLMKPYQVPVPNGGMLKKKQGMLMVRPPYPPIYRESQMPHASDISEVAVIVKDAWKVGDLVDWLTDDCYWSGRIKQLVGHDKAMIKFPKPPLGEGTRDEEAPLKDLRPSLDWSPEYGWIVPTPGGEAGCPCARLIKAGDQGRETGADNMEAGSSPDCRGRPALFQLSPEEMLQGLNGKLWNTLLPHPCQNKCSGNDPELGDKCHSICQNSRITVGWSTDMIISTWYLGDIAY